MAQEKKIATNSTPIHLRNSDRHAAEVFDHAGFIADLCKWWKPAVFVEYGVRTGTTTFKVAPHCQTVIGVDIHKDEKVANLPNVLFYQMTTDNFKTNHLDKDLKKLVIDVAFIDAWHESHQVLRDFSALWPHIVEDGLVFLHDTYPMREMYLQPGYCNDCWKSPFLIKHFFGNECDIFTIPVQPGLTVVRKLRKPPLQWLNPATIDFKSYQNDLFQLGSFMQ